MGDEMKILQCKQKPASVADWRMHVSDALCSLLEYAGVPQLRRVARGEATARRHSTATLSNSAWLYEASCKGNVDRE